MLKRQRQQSPPPSRPTVADPADETTPVSRGAKRRRTAPPVLDGALRGWNLEYGDEEEEEDFSDDGRHPSEPPPQHGTMHEYSATNNVLRELHILNQHRHLFSPSATKDLPVSIPVPRNASNQIYSPPSHFSPPSKAELFPQPQLYQDSTAASQLTDAAVGKAYAVVGKEMSHVQKHYEGTNKLLGELFLSRRRETDPS